MKTKAFSVYRYMLSPISAQRSLFDDYTKSKEELFSELMITLVNKSKTEESYKSRRYLLYGIQENKEIFVFKFARESNLEIAKEGEHDIKSETIKEAPYVYLFFSTRNQIILLQNKTSVFKEQSTAIKVLDLLLNNTIRKFGYSINIYPLVKENKFWSYVKKSSRIYGLQLEFNAPNLLFGNKDTRAGLSILKEKYNNDSYEESIKNKEGLLNICKEDLGDSIDYITEVAGRYKLDHEVNGVRQITLSENDIAKVYLLIKNGKYSSSELDAIQNKCDRMHSIDKRKEECE